MTASDWIYHYGFQAIEWLKPIVLIGGLMVAIWAFRRCRKSGYLLIAMYFAIYTFTLLAMPAINRAIQARQAPDYDAQTQQKIDAAINEAVQKVLSEEERPHGLPMRRTLHLPIGETILVVGLWLLARREQRCEASRITPIEQGEQPSA